MSMSLITPPSGLFVRLGKIGAITKAINTTRGNIVGNDVDVMHGCFNTSLQSLMDNTYTQRDSFRNANGSYLNTLKTLASNVLISQADADAKLVSKDITTALGELIRQMVSGSASVDANTVTGS